MGFIRRAWEALLETQRLPPVRPRMTPEEVEAVVQNALADRGGVHPEERVYSQAGRSGDRVVWDVYVRRPEAAFGAHVHLHIDDATGQILKVFHVPD